MSTIKQHTQKEYYMRTALLDELHSIKSNVKNRSMTTQQYRTLKGMITHYRFDEFYHTLVSLGLECDIATLKGNIVKYAESAMDLESEFINSHYHLDEEEAV